MMALGLAASPAMAQSSEKDSLADIIAGCWVQSKTGALEHAEYELSITRDDEDVTAEVPSRNRVYEGELEGDALELVYKFDGPEDLADPSHWAGGNVPSEKVREQIIDQMPISRFVVTGFQKDKIQLIHYGFRARWNAEEKVSFVEPKGFNYVWTRTSKITLEGISFRDDEFEDEKTKLDEKDDALYLEATGKTGCDVSVDQLLVRIAPDGDEDKGTLLVLTETGPDTNIYRSSPSGIELRDGWTQAARLIARLENGSLEAELLTGATPPPQTDEAEADEAEADEAQPEAPVAEEPAAEEAPAEAAPVEEPAAEEPAAAEDEDAAAEEPAAESAGATGVPLPTPMPSRDEPAAGDDAADEADAPAEEPEGEAETPAEPVADAGAAEEPEPAVEAEAESAAEEAAEAPEAQAESQEAAPEAEEPAASDAAGKAAEEVSEAPEAAPVEPEAAQEVAEEAVEDAAEEVSEAPEAAPAETAEGAPVQIIPEAMESEPAEVEPVKVTIDAKPAEEATPEAPAEEPAGAASDAVEETVEEETALGDPVTLEPAQAEATEDTAVEAAEPEAAGAEVQEWNNPDGETTGRPALAPAKGNSFLSGSTAAPEPATDTEVADAEKLNETLADEAAPAEEADAPAPEAQTEPQEAESQEAEEPAAAPELDAAGQAMNDAYRQAYDSWTVQIDQTNAEAKELEDKAFSAFDEGGASELNDQAAAKRAEAKRLEGRLKSDLDEAEQLFRDSGNPIPAWITDAKAALAESE